jgi:Fe-Mn family superoxide dismutase
MQMLKQCAHDARPCLCPQLPPLKYGYGELEPIISGQIMEIHHTKHHNT